jgi:hypothetical protein
MPTPKFTPGAQLIPLSLTSPAFQGVNLEAQGSVLGREWATTLDNAVFDDAGRPEARKGWTSLTGSAVAGIIMRIHEYYKADGTSAIISSTDADIFEGTSTLTSREGTLGITEGNIKFVNFNDKCIAFGVGTSGEPAVKTTGNFVEVVESDGAAPTGRIGTSAFGRLWGVDTDGKTMKYSALLDETDWGTTNGGGSIDFSNVWPAGQDNIVAIEEFGGDLIVFGSNNTVIMTDGQGSNLGIDPTAMYVSDTIPGQGALSQFAICRAAGDLWVLTASGIIGLKRELVQRSTPTTNLSKNVQSQVRTLIASESDLNDITLEYSEKDAMVVANFPASDKQIVFDTRAPLPDGTYRATTWTSDLQTLAYDRGNRRFIGSLTGTVGEIMNHANYTDDGTTYIFDYESGWLDLGDELNVLLKFVKRLTSFVFVQQNTAVTHKVAFDFGSSSFSLQKSVSGGRVAEWGVFEWGANGKYDKSDPNAVAGTDVAEWSGSVTISTLDAPLGGSGQYIKVGVSVNTSSGSFALQQVNLMAKVGRIAT